MSDQTAASGLENGRITPTMRWTAFFILLAAAAIGVYAYWNYSAIYPSTNNAYTKASIVRVAPQVSGSVLRVYVEDNQTVEKGDPLLDIDPSPYDALVRGTEAQFDVSANDVGDAAKGLKDSYAALKDQRKKLIDARAAYQRARDEAKSPSDPAVLDAKKAWHDALDAFNKSQDAFGAAQEAAVADTPDMVQLRGTAAQLDKAVRDRIRTFVNAPTDGRVTEMNLWPGTVVGAGSPLFAIIDTDQWWVDANFKETDLKNIRPGQPATVVLDMYPDMKIAGKVDSISSGSGATFSALPAENATGNWVKVTQRFTVRVALPKPPEDPNRPLRVGASASVQVDTAKQQGVEQAQK